MSPAAPSGITRVQPKPSQAQVSPSFEWSARLPPNRSRRPRAPSQAPPPSQRASGFAWVRKRQVPSARVTADAASTVDSAAPPAVAGAAPWTR